MITIETDKASYAMGETVHAKITLSLGKAVKARSLVAAFFCEERHRVTEQRVMDKYDYDREREMGGFKETHMYSTTSEHVERLSEQRKTVSGGKEYSSGEFSVSFAIPARGPPTSREFGHDNRIHTWKLHVKLDIPLAIDENSEKEIFVEGL